MKKHFYFEIYRSGWKVFTPSVIVEIIVYCSTFLLSGLLRSDIFNILGHMPTRFDLGLLPLVLFSALLPIITNSVKQINAYTITYSENKFSGYVREKLYHIYLGSPSCANRLDTGTLLTHFDEDIREVVSLLMLFYAQLPRFILSIGALVLMIRVDVFSTVISFLPLIVVTTIAQLLGKKIMRARAKNRRAKERTIEALSQIFVNIPVFKTCPQAADRAARSYEEQLKARAECAVRDTMLSESLNILSDNVMNIALGIILLAVSLSQNSRLSVGDIVLFQYYLNFMSSLPGFASRLIKQLKLSNLSLHRLIDATDGAILLPESPAARKPEADFQNIHIAVRKVPYLPQELPDVELKITKGSLIAVKGDVGTGKTMLLQALMGFHGMENVTWEVDGRTMSAVPYGLCAFVSQSPSLLSGTLRDNVCMGKSLTDAELNQIAGLAAFETDLADLSDRWETQVGRCGSKLSGGQIKRVAYMRAIASGARLLVIDDYASGLDEVTQGKLRQRLFETKRCALIIGTNDDQIIRQADAVVDLNCVRSMA